MQENKVKNRRLSWLLLIPVIAVVFPEFYNFREPAVAGIPFFYWYQIAWVFLTAGLTWLIWSREG
jgi:hypothetical protein